jgi:hypothetical protein
METEHNRSKWCRSTLISSIAIAAFVGLVLVVGCGGGHSSPSTGTPQNPAPSISSLNPGSLAAGSPAQTLTINGTGFAATTLITFNGTTHPVTFIGANQLTIQLTAADLATAGTFPVVATNPAPGGGSASATFTVVAANAVPAITSLSPSSLPSGSAAQTLAINGTDFLSSSTVTFNSAIRAATFVSASELTIALTSEDLSTVGTYAVVVTNPAPGGGASNSISFSVEQTSNGGAALLWGEMVVPTTNLGYPDGVAADANGNIYVSDYDGGSPDDPTMNGTPAIVKIDPQGNQSAAPTSGVNSPYGLAVGGNGDIYIADEEHSRVVKVDSQGNQTTVADVHEVQSVAVDGQGNLFAVRSPLDGFDLLKIDPQGVQTVLATGMETRTIAADASGNVYGEDDIAGSLLKWDVQGHKSVLKSGLSDLQEFAGVAPDANENLYFETDTGLFKLSPAGDVTTVLTTLNEPEGMAIDGSGNILIADTGNVRILKLQPGPSVEIGITPVGQTASGTLTYQINTGIAVGSVAVSSTSSGEFSLAPAATCAPSNGQCTFSVIFAPTMTGIRTGTVTLRDENNQPLVTTPLFGLGK